MVGLKFKRYIIFHRNATFTHEVINDLLGIIKNLDLKFACWVRQTIDSNDAIGVHG